MWEIEMNIGLIALLAKRLIAVCVVSLIVWHVTHFGSAPRGRVLVFAPRQNDVVIIDAQDYPVESLERPLVCDLESGQHVLRVKRGQLTVAEEEFTIEPEKELVVIPRDRTEVVKPRTLRKVDREATSPAGLAIRTRRFRPTQE
jgi:hypothetical protein